MIAPPSTNKTVALQPRRNGQPRTLSAPPATRSKKIIAAPASATVGKVKAPQAGVQPPATSQGSVRAN